MRGALLRFVLRHSWIRTYRVVSCDHFGLWLRLAHWRMFFLSGPRRGFTVQVGPVNVRFGVSWEYLGREKRDQ